MKLWLKIVCVFVLAFFAIFSLVFLISHLIEGNFVNVVKSFFYTIQNNLLNQYPNVANSASYFVKLIFVCVSLSALSIVNIIFLFKKSPEFKYEYQYYIEQKQAKKKQKLQEKLDKMEKGE